MQIQKQSRETEQVWQNLDVRFRRGKERVRRWAMGQSEQVKEGKRELRHEYQDNRETFGLYGPENFSRSPRNFLGNQIL